MFSRSKTEIAVTSSIVIFVILTGIALYLHASFTGYSKEEFAKLNAEKLWSEKNNPAFFLLDKSSLKHSVPDRKLILEGIICNNSSAVTYSNIILKVVLYNKNSIQLNTDNIIISKTITPTQIIDYKINLKGSESAKYADVIIIKADVKENI
ncbi:MAG: hypothetical protein H0W73_16895 [Bacteroidetes bacterium]|nr:hypothetical protein [Bacteroidota bacterium]